MRKLTRRSYNRKLIMFGLAIFLAVGMISTGFSAWVMSAAAKAEADGTVYVGTVSDTSMSITIDNLTDGKLNDTFSFDARKDDTAGEITYGDGKKSETDTAEPGEDLQIVISGKITNPSSLGTLTMTIDLPDQFSTAIEYGLLKLKNGETLSTDGKAIIVLDIDDLSWDEDGATDDKGNTLGTFTYTLEFEWGAFFGNVNPGDFYDPYEDNDGVTQVHSAKRTYSVAKNEDEGATTAYKWTSITETTVYGDGTDGISAEQMKNEVYAFRELLTGSSDAEVAFDGTIDITIEAKANS